MILLKQMTILFLVMLVGAVCRKLHYISDEANKKISAIVVNVANPALILSAGINQKATIAGMEFVKTFVLAWGMFGVLILLAQVLPLLIRSPKENIGIYKAMTLFSNIGFLGFPVISALYGSEALLYASLFLIPFNVLFYTYGIQILKKDSDKVAFQWKSVFNVGVVASIISLIIYLLHIPIPSVLESANTYVSNLTAPLSMMIIGDNLARADLRKMIRNKRLLVFCAVKLILIPVIGVSLIKLIGCNPILIGVSMVMLSTPVGSMTAMVAQEYDGDYELASSGVIVSTVLSVLTMPFVAFLLGT